MSTSVALNNPPVKTRKRWGPTRLAITLVLCVIGWGIVAAGCLCVGSSTRHFHWPTNDAQMHTRREMVLMASLIGAALSAAGVVYQAVFRNPLADPSLLGVSSGASLSAYVWRFSTLAFLSTSAGAFGQQAFAFAGAIVAMGIVFLLSMRRGKLEPITLLLVGVIVNSIAGSIFLLLNTIRQDMSDQLAFLVGGIQTNLTLPQEQLAIGAVAICWLMLFYISGQLNAAVLGEAEAAALGVRINRLRWLALLTASLMTAAAVAVSGPIGFIGLVCPHVARLLVGNDQRKLLPVATAIGAALLAVADAASRQLSNASLAQTILPVGVLTGLLGGPFYLLLLWRARHRNFLPSN